MSKPPLNTDPKTAPLHLLFARPVNGITLAGMRKHSAFELQVLGWVAGDFEAPHTITSDIARDLKRSVSEAEVRAALLALVQSGLVQAYLYEPAGRRYKPIPHREAEAAQDLWFMATEAGIAQCERSAS